MTKQKSFWILLFLSILGSGVGYVLSNAYAFGFCGVSLLCTSIMDKGTAAFYGLAATAGVFILLLLIPKAIKTWGKFAIWYLPLMFIYFAIYKNQGFFSLPEEAVYRFLSLVYLVVSLVIIVFVAIRKK